MQITQKQSTLRVSASINRLHKELPTATRMQTYNLSAGQTLSFKKFYSTFKSAYPKVAALKGITSKTADNRANRFAVIAAYTAVSNDLKHANLAIKAKNYYSSFTIIDADQRANYDASRVQASLESYSVLTSK